VHVFAELILLAHGADPVLADLGTRAVAHVAELHA
jgi:hypothetical protein